MVVVVDLSESTVVLLGTLHILYLDSAVKLINLI